MYKRQGLKYKSLQRTVDRRCLRPEDVSNDEKLSLKNNNYSSLAILHTIVVYLSVSTSLGQELLAVNDRMDVNTRYCV